jgi:trigger factor
MSASSVKRLDATQVELEFAVPQAEVERAREHVFRELSRTARLPGFRPGKIPRKVFEKAYGTAGMEARVFDRIVPDAYERAVRENQIEPVAPPEVEVLSSEADGDMRIRATIAVRPAIALGEYRGIEIGTPDATVPEDEVARSLESLRRGSAELVPVDRPVRAGDVATLDFSGTIDGVAFEGGSAQNQAVEIAEDRFIPGFATGVFGMSAGETKEIEARFPDDYDPPALAGKVATFTVRVHDVKEAHVPELDDQFAASMLREGGTVEQLRSDLRDRLTRTHETRARRTMTGELLERLAAMHEVALPQVMVDRETESLFEDARRDVTRSGVSWEEYLERSKRSETDVRDEARAEAERRVKTSLLLDAIARAEGIEATKADVDAELGNLSRQYGRPLNEIAEMLRPNMAALFDGVVRSKTVEFLVSHARRGEATAESEE